MKIISWNINGLRAIIKKKDFFELIEQENPDIICLGETKLSCPILSTQQIINKKLPNYVFKYWHPSSSRKGYSGTAIFSKIEPINDTYGLKDLDDEGRVITLEFNKFFLVHVYTPNSGQELKRLDFRTKVWDKEFRKYIKKLDKSKPVIVTGDLNVANEEIDIANPNSNKRSAGFTDEERKGFKKHLKSIKLIDTFRHFNPDEVKYSYWTYLGGARKRNKGWRLDYFLVSKRLLKKVNDSDILTNIMGSDHAPVILKLKNNLV